MAEVKKEVNPSNSEDGGGKTIEARFAHFCKNDLRLDDDKFLAQAAKLFNESKHLVMTNVAAMTSGTPDEAERYWFAFVLYTARRLIDNGGSLEKGLTVCQILKAARLNLHDFYKELHHFLIKAGSILSNLYGQDWAKRLEAKESQTNFVHLIVLSRKYERAYGEIFAIVDANNDKHLNAANPSGCRSDYYRFGWLLFLALRVHVFGLRKDLVTCTHGLVSVLAILLIHVPAQFRNFNLNDSERIVKKDDKADLLASLCKMHETSEDELWKTLEKANNLISDLLKKKPCLASDCKNENLENIVKDGLIYFEDLMDESSLSSSITLLDKDYDASTRSMRELDERIFINEDDSLIGSGSLSGGAVNLNGNGAKRKFYATMSSPTKTVTGPLSPFRSPASHSIGSAAGVMPRIVSTPVTTAMTTLKWLRTVIVPLSSKPSAELERFLSSCDRDVTTDITRRADVILGAIFPSSGPGQNASLMDNEWAKQRRLEAMKLYFRVLQAICTAESQILHANNLTSLLTNERFHRCMLACSAELVLATHKTVTMLFPTVLERTGITAFDLCKVIESFIRHEETLPRELRRHLNSLEERLLESNVWEKGSSMYSSLIVARPAFSAEINRLGLLAEPMPSLDAIAAHIDMSCGALPPMQSVVKQESGHNGDIRSPKRVCTEYRSVLVERNSFTSPVKDRLLALNNLKSKVPPPVLHSAFASPTRPNPGGAGETCAETAVNVFFSKIVKLAAVRINGMVERLQLSHQIKESVYRLFQKILGQRTTLFFNRHIDQIILCCFYGLAKISQLNLTFKEIIFNYRKQPQCKPQVFRSVYVDWTAPRRKGKTGPDHVDIISFYNEVFVPEVKPLLVEFAPGGGSAQNSSNALEARNNIDGPCPPSPKPTSFPSLPDMSPKKVSAAHNVYVSPLRSSKMDALISHSSKSYYACVGESTHAYQSPSKDLTAINNRLNGNRKLRGALNFDDVDVGLVTDSMIAKSLCIQNGNSASSSHNPVKSEQPDS